MDKVVSIIVPGKANTDYDDLVEARLAPNATVRMVLEKSRLQGYMLRTDQGTFLAESDNLYGLVTQGQKLVAIPNMQVG